MSAEPPGWIRDLLSTPRLRPYLRASDGSAEVAVRLYWWNSAVSAAFYGPLHCLEIGLRNALHGTLSGHYGRPDWWTLAPLSPHGARKVKDAREKLAGPDGRQAGPDDVVAALTFGFWVALLSRGYDRTFWVPVLHRAFPHYRGSRRELHDNFDAMLRLRNRVMHYEPIHHRDLVADRAKIYRLLSYLSPEAAREIELLDRIPEVLSRRGEIRTRDDAPRF
ncbi:protein of unknown function DUF1526 [Parafrankia sp. EAN1pec]|uniref:hypothetical protein n=1 Tax=Parafrankia sp. (strain EAN1pec) TaxID=298653 RepID=UPI0000541FAD|nr:protein of unknown function DUF1526 [Frankia sp. EAN1pec]